VEYKQNQWSLRELIMKKFKIVNLDETVIKINGRRVFSNYFFLLPYIGVVRYNDEYVIYGGWLKYVIAYRSSKESPVHQENTQVYYDGIPWKFHERYRC
jgi:hypothetical protein